MVIVRYKSNTLPLCYLYLAARRCPVPFVLYSSPIPFLCASCIVLQCDFLFHISAMVGSLKVFVGNDGKRDGGRLRVGSGREQQYFERSSIVERNYIIVVRDAIVLERNNIVIVIIEFVSETEVL